MKFKGLGVAVITPFTSDKKVDYPSLKKIISHLIDGGVDYLVMLGTTGESVTLNSDEKQKIVNTAIELSSGKTPIVRGIGSNHTAHVCKELERTDLEGVDAILSVSPYYNKPSQDGIYAHYKTISEASPKPIILYNVPGRTGSNISAGTTLSLANDCPNIIAVKEASGNFDQIMHIVQHKPKDFLVISGDDALTLPLLSIGLDGVISVIGNAFPAKFSAMIKAFMNNNTLEARNIHYQLLDYTNMCFAEGSPSGIKGLMNLMGLCETIVRQPLFPIKQELYNRFKTKLQQEGLI